MNREFALGPAKAPPPSPVRTGRVLHRFTTFGGWERRFTTLTGAIHNFGPLIHNLVHNFWQGNGSNGDLSTEIAILTGAASRLSMPQPLPFLLWVQPPARLWLQLPPSLSQPHHLVVFMLLFVWLTFFPFHRCDLDPLRPGPSNKHEHDATGSAVMQ